MSTERVLIEGPCDLEGIVRRSGTKSGVVICHPHPLYGGSMFNNVVNAMEEGFFQKGFTTVRFNFRGVGESGGSYGDGEGEVEDVLAACEYLASQLDDDGTIWFAGYSFGAWVCTRASLKDDRPHNLFLVSYPFAFYAAEPLFDVTGDIYFVAGEFDDIGPIDATLKVYESLPLVGKNLKIIPTDHFYAGKEREILQFIVDRVGL